MELILRRNKTWYFNRWVPIDVREYDPRKIVRFSLKTDSQKAASSLAAMENQKLERYWQSLIESGIKYADSKYRQTVSRASTYGFVYTPASDLAHVPFAELEKRLAFVEKMMLVKPAVEAVLGGVEPPRVRLDEALGKFFELSTHIQLTKNDDQIRKWKNPRSRAMKNLIACVGNKHLNELTRDDFVEFRKWWIERILQNNLTTAVANKNFSQLKTILETIFEHYQIKGDVKNFFYKLSFEKANNKRPSFSTDHILNVLFNPEKLGVLEDAQQKMLYVFSETGISLDEQLKILPEHIRIHEPIPYVSLVPAHKKLLKTKFRKRDIPLVGYALEAFQAYPNGFSELYSDPDSLSTEINKILRLAGMFPTEKHSVYSLRHSFQDRLTNSKCLDRVQADLMGHRFKDREEYGEGATLKTKYKGLLKIKLKR